MASVLFKFGTPAQYAALASTGYDTNSLYFIQEEGATEGVLYKGSTRYSPEKQVVFTSSTPVNPESNKIYVVNDGSGNVSIVVSDGSGGSTVVGGGTVAEGAITDIGAFDDSILVTSAELVDGVLPEGDTTIPTSGAVKSAIESAISGVTSTSLGLDAAIVNVSSARAEDNKGTILTFTPKSGDAINVTVADLFLSNAAYNSETHVLTLTVAGTGEDPAYTVDINLEELVPQAVNASQVALARSITATVDVGNVKKGDKIELATVTDVQKLFEKILSQDSNPTTTQPSVSVSLTGAGSKEVGTSFTPSYSVTFNAGSYSDNAEGSQPTGVTATGYSVTDTNSNSASTASGSFTAFTVEDSTNYKVSATVTYGDGNIPTTFLGEAYPAGQIKAGSKSGSSSAVTGYRSWFMYVGTDNTTAIDSAFIRSATNKANGKNASTQNNVAIAAGTKRVMIALPSISGYTKRLKSVIDVDGMGLDVFGNFTQTTVSVEGLNGYDAVDYIVYTAENANGLAATKYNFVIG